MAKKYQHLIQEMTRADLATIPFHFNTGGIERFVAEGFPIHFAMHKVSGVDNQPLQYVELHKHNSPEINIIIGENEKLVYDIQIDDEQYAVCSPATIWIPKGVAHSANVIRGSGYFICLILEDEYRAFTDD